MRFNEKLEIKKLFEFEKSQGYDYSNEFIEKFTKAWKKSTPKIIKEIKQEYPEDSEDDILKELIETVDVDLTVQYGKYME